MSLIFFFQAEDCIRYRDVTGVQTCALPISLQPKKVRHQMISPKQLLCIHLLLKLICTQDLFLRSEERRVGKECSSMRSVEHMREVRVYVTSKAHGAWNSATSDLDCERSDIL